MNTLCFLFPRVFALCVHLCYSDVCSVMCFPRVCGGVSECYCDNLEGSFPRVCGGVSKNTAQAEKESFPRVCGGVSAKAGVSASIHLSPRMRRCFLGGCGRSEGTFPRVCGGVFLSTRKNMYGKIDK